MRARLPLCRPIEKWLGRRLTPLEDTVFYALQDMRRRRGCIRMMVCDPRGVDSRQAILTYMAYLADTDPRYADIAVVAPSARTARALTATTDVIADRDLMRRHNIFCVGAGHEHSLRGLQYSAAVLLDADLYRGLTAIHRAVVSSFLFGQGVYIVHSREPLWLAPVFGDHTDFRRPPPDRPGLPVLIEMVEYADEDTSASTNGPSPYGLPRQKTGVVRT